MGGKKSISIVTSLDIENQVARQPPRIDGFCFRSPAWVGSEFGVGGVGSGLRPTKGYRRLGLDCGWGYWGTEPREG